MDQQAFFTLSYGVYLLTSATQDARGGCIVNTACQVTNAPAQLSVTVSKNNYTQELIASSGKFAAMPLTVKADMDFISRFGFRSGRDGDKFEGLPITLDEQGLPVVTDMVAARFTCTVSQRLDVGSHVMFVGEVVGAERLAADDVMTYAHYHQVKRGKTPANAPSFQKEEEKAGWRCMVCGYVHEDETLPEGFICPWCGNPVSFFEKIV